MCFCNKLPEPTKPKTPKSPWRRNLREPMKPRLSRKIVPSARVNLNAYWSKFEELSKQTSLIVTYDAPNSIQALNSMRYSTYSENEVNENLINELMETGNK